MNSIDFNNALLIDFVQTKEEQYNSFKYMEIIFN